MESKSSAMAIMASASERPRMRTAKAEQEMDRLPVPTGPVLEFNLRLNTKQCLDLHERMRATPTDDWETPDSASPIISPDCEELPLEQRARIPQQLEEPGVVRCVPCPQIGGGQFGPTITRTFSLIINTIDPLYFLLVSLVNALKNIEVSLVHTTSAVVVIGVQSSLAHQPHWLFFLLDSDEGCSRRWQWLAACSMPWVDITWQTLSCALGLFGPGNFVLPQLNTDRVQALVTPKSAPSCPNACAEGPEQIAPAFWACQNGANKRATPPSVVPEKADGRKRARYGAGSSGGSSSAGGGGGGDVSGPVPRGKRAARKEPNKSGRQAFACHYYKRWPFKHMACLHHSQRAPRYVKTHLLRSHRQPMHCPTCFRTFQLRVAYNDHVVGRTCDGSEGTCPSFMDDISDDQERALNGLPGGDSPEKWYAMWAVLFPDEPPPNSPFVDTEDNEGNVVVAVRDARMPRFRDGLADLQRSGQLNAAQVRLVQRVHDEAYAAGPGPPATANTLSHQPLQLQQRTQGTHSFGGSNSHTLLTPTPTVTSQPPQPRPQDFFPQPPPQRTDFFGGSPTGNSYQQGSSALRTNRQVAIQATSYLHHDTRPPDQPDAQRQRQGAQHRRLVTAQGPAPTAMQQRLSNQGGVGRQPPPTMPVTEFPHNNIQLQPNQLAMARQQYVRNMVLGDTPRHGPPMDMFFQGPNIPRGPHTSTAMGGGRHVQFNPTGMPPNGFGGAPAPTSGSLLPRRQRNPRAGAANALPGTNPGGTTVLDPVLDFMTEATTQSTEHASTGAGPGAAEGHEQAPNDPSDLSDVGSDFFNIDGPDSERRPEF